MRGSDGKAPAIWSALCAAIAIGFALSGASDAVAARAGSPDPVRIDAGNGTLTVDRSPLRLSLRDARGNETVGTVAGRQGPPVRLPGIDGPQPIEPLGALGGFPALGFVVGADFGTTHPVGFFTGNRLFGAEAGVLVSAVAVASARRTPQGAELRLRTDAPALGPATLTVSRLRAGGVRLDLRPPRALRPRSTVFSLRSPRGEGLYGLGGRKDSFDQRGRLRNVWVEQQNASDERVEPLTGADPTATLGSDYTFPNGSQAAYYVQAALHGSRGWAAWVRGSALSRVDLAHSRADAIRWGVAGPRLSLALAGGGIERAARSYSAATGRGPAPPRYAYEPWIDVINEGEGEAAPNGTGFSGGARVKRELEQIVRKAREFDLPVGTLGVEGWQQVPDAKRFFGGLRRRGFHLSAYWNPFTARGTPAFDEAQRLGILIKDPLGNPYPVLTTRGRVDYVIDYSHPAARGFWTRQIRRSSELGFEAFMNDFGEFVTEGMTFHSGRPNALEHNAYPVRYHRAARQALDAYADTHPGFKPFFYVRAGFSGTEADDSVAAATPSAFPGDETTDWSQGSGIPSVIPAMLNLAMGGSYAFTTDVGGYLDLLAPRTSPELLARWSQLAAFTAISRVHNSTFKGSLYPWEAGSATLDVYRRYAKAKVRLIPLVERWAKRAARDGTIGPVRPLVLDDRSPRARSIDDEWRLGKDILVAPVLRRGARSRRVYLPGGARWRRVVVGRDGRLVFSGPALAGGRTLSAAAPLADIPLYRRVSATATRATDSTRGSGTKPRPRSRTRATAAAEAGPGTPAHSASSGGGLPRTGLALTALVVTGVALVGGGNRLRGRRRSRRRGREDTARPPR